MTVIEFSAVSFGYGDEQVFDDISFVSDRPELLCILGPNGVGKTTLVKCMNKLLKPDSGQVLIDGKDVQDYSLLELAQIMAYVPNSTSSVFSMTVSEAILMGRHPHAGWTTSDRDLEIVDEAIDTMSLQEFADRDIRELSSGQLQRVMIARGLVQEPGVLILDEPTSNLDVKYQMNVMRFLRDYSHEKKITVVMVCHDLNITAAYADRVILMSGGGVHADGMAEDVLTQENIRDVYDVDARIVDVDGRPYIALMPES